MSSKEKTFQTSATKIEFLGSPYGEGAERLERDMTTRIQAVPEVTGAYFCMVRHVSEENDKLALLIDSDNSKNDFVQALAQNCSGSVPMDLMFLEDLEPSELANVKEKCKRFYNNET